MTDEEANKILEDLLEFYDNDLPNPDQEPIRFAHYIKLYKYYRAVK